MNLEIHSIPIQNSYWVIPGRMRAGAHPGFDSVGEIKNRLFWLIDLGINHIVDLTSSKESNENYLAYINEVALVFNKQIEYQKFSIQDWSTPPEEMMVEILERIDSALSEGKNIYLHCYGGKGRTGTVVGCYLAQHGETGERALKKIEELRKEIADKNDRSPETEEQRKMVLEWIKRKLMRNLR